MLIRITNKCTMGCSHCMVDATPEGEHMAFSTFLQCLTFACKIGSQMVFLTGGEPTLHPELVGMLGLIRDKGLQPLLTSNGLFLSEMTVKERDDILGGVDSVQVTNDPRYYPRRVERPAHPKVYYEDTLRMMSPFGRAVTNGLECTRLAPMCFNLRSAVRQIGGLSESLLFLRGHGKFCTPAINVDGTIVAGEAPSCHPIGTVWDELETIAANIRTMTCAKCGLVDNLTPEQRGAIGE
jgi:hypothetical protein